MTRPYRRKCARCSRIATELYDYEKAQGSGSRVVRVCGECFTRAGGTHICRVCFDLPHRREPVCRGCGEAHEDEGPVVTRIYTGVSSLGELVKGQWSD